MTRNPLIRAVSALALLTLLCAPAAAQSAVMQYWGRTAPAAAIAPNATTVAANSRIVCTTPCSLMNIDVTSGASAGVVYVFDAVALPADGTVTPKKCYEVAVTSSFSKTFSPPLRMSVGAVVAFGTGTSCFTLANSATAFISAEGK